MRTIVTTLGATSVTIIALAAFVGRVSEPPRAETNGRMATAAAEYVGTLGSTDRDRGTWELDAEQRLDWHFVPWERYGVRLKNMNLEQRTAAHGLLQSVLSSQGYL